jgi:hypothetical protein
VLHGLPPESVGLEGPEPHGGDIDATLAPETCRAIWALTLMAAAGAPYRLRRRLGPWRCALLKRGMERSATSDSTCAIVSFHVPSGRWPSA